MLKERLALAKKFYEQQHNRKFKQVELAEKVNVSKPSVGYWFSGSTKCLDGQYLFKVAEYFGVNPKWLAGEDVPMIEGIGVNIDQIEKINSNDNEVGQSASIQNTTMEHLQLKRALENLNTSLKIKIEHANLTEVQILKIAAQIDQVAIKIINL